jgi:hypothetical protein
VKTGWENAQFMDVGILFRGSPLFIEYDDKSHSESTAQIRDGFKTAWAQEQGYPLIRITHYNITLKQIKNAIVHGLQIRRGVTKGKARRVR